SIAPRFRPRAAGGGCPGNGQDRGRIERECSVSVGSGNVVRLALAVALVGALVGFAVACGPVPPAARPKSSSMSDVAPIAPPPSVRVAAARERIIGLVCPRGALGRPALAALAERLPRAWSADPVKLRRALASGRATDVAVLGFDGRRAGW